MSSRNLKKSKRLQDVFLSIINHDPNTTNWDIIRETGSTRPASDISEINQFLTDGQTNLRIENIRSHTKKIPNHWEIKHHANYSPLAAKYHPPKIIARLYLRVWQANDELPF